LEDAKADEAKKQARLDEANAVYNAKKEECDEACEERRVWDEELNKLETEMKQIGKALEKLEVVKIKRDNAKETKVGQVKGRLVYRVNVNA
jgi:hypothetical protein